MKCGHLFNGISGFGLAASWMGWENYMHCEIDPFCSEQKDGTYLMSESTSLLVNLYIKNPIDFRKCKKNVL